MMEGKRIAALLLAAAVAAQKKASFWGDGSVPADCFYRLQ